MGLLGRAVCAYQSSELARRGRRGGAAAPLVPTCTVCRGVAPTFFDTLALLPGLRQLIVDAPRQDCSPLLGLSMLEVGERGAVGG